MFGLKHSGKSSVGQELARRLGWPFYDLDEMISEEDPDRRNPRAIFKESGRDVFQDYERRAASRLGACPPPLVLALGGGTVENSAAMKILDGCSNRVWIWLEEDWDVLYERIRQGGLPSFLDPQNPRESFMTMAARRREMAESYAPRILKVGGRSIDECVEEIIDWKEAGFAG